MKREDDDDKSLKQAIKEGDYLVVDLTVPDIREYLSTGDSDALAELDSLLDECQGNIYDDVVTEQFIVVRIRR